MLKNSIVNRIAGTKVMAVVRISARERAVEIVEGLLAGGVDVMEISYNSDDATDHIRYIARNYPDMLVGAGTVTSPELVQMAADAGAMYIISPDTDIDVIKKTRELGLVSMPGVFPPSEACDAVDFGADFVKLFPVTNMGSSYVKAIKAPLSHIKFLAVGGIDETNIQEYLDAGVSGFGIGSNITNKKMIDNNDWAGLTALAKKYSEVICHG